MKKLTYIFLLLFVLSFIPAQAHAQGTPVVLWSTLPMGDELREYINAWLAVDPPSDAPYYIVTNWKTKNGLSRVSLLGVSSQVEKSTWSFEENGNSIVWMGSVKVDSAGTVELISKPTPQAMNRMSAPPPTVPGAGGGTYVAFPFQAGKAMIYGPRAVHGSGDYGTNGMLAVDLVSGDDLGPGAAPPYVYASDAGTIDYVCADATNVAVRTYNASTGDYFVYAHLQDNENLIEGTAFTRGQLIGSLVYGTFDDNCGWAQQQEDHYHLHWMFVPSNNAYQAEGCILSISTKKWTCGTETIGTGGWLKGGGGSGTGLDDVTGSSGAYASLGFWDYFLNGLLQVFSVTLLANMPTHQEVEYLYTITNTISLVIKIAYVLLRSNINIIPMILVLFVGFQFQLFMFLVWFLSSLLKAWKSLVPILGA